MLYALLAALLVVLDQAVKFYIRANLPLSGSAPFLPPLLELTYVQNTGAAFSILAQHTWILTLFSLVMVAAMIWLLAKKKIPGRFGQISTLLILAGGIGNLIDRVWLGYVTDMFRTLFMNFAVFNVADCFITVGVAMLCVYILFFYDKDVKKGGGDDDHTHPVSSDDP